MSKKELKMSLQEIRDKIDLSSHPWANRRNSNCYAYALGLDIDEAEIVDSAYQPGTMSDLPFTFFMGKYFGYNDLISSILSDLSALGIEYREIKPFTRIDDDEWKIALFVNGSWLLEDFHFLRQSKDGSWYHKDGYIGEVTNLDDKGDIIRDPEHCYLEYKNYCACYSLRLR